MSTPAEKQQEVIYYASKRIPATKIATLVGLHRHTVRKYIEAHREAIESGPFSDELCAFAGSVLYIVASMTDVALSISYVMF
jgi:predicted transcriptional regulator